MRSQKHLKIQLFPNLIKTCKSCSRPGGGLVFNVWLGPKRHIFEVFSEGLWMLPSKTTMVEKCNENCAQKGVYFGAGAPSCTFGVPVCFWTQKVYPECSQNDPKGAKVTLQCSKSNLQGRKMDSYKNAKVVQVHEKISAARYQARWTARSAYYDQKHRRRLRQRRPPHWACVSDYLIS